MGGWDSLEGSYNVDGLVLVAISPWLPLWVVLGVGDSPRQLFLFHVKRIVESPGQVYLLFGSHVFPTRIELVLGNLGKRHHPD